MGQYWKTVNLDKREYICPHKLGAGLKLWEQVNNPPGTPVALFILTTAMPHARGGGDLKHHPAIGRWAGDRIVTIGDYAEDSDVPKSRTPASILYSLCRSQEDLDDLRDVYREQVRDRDAYTNNARQMLKRLRGRTAFTDVSDMVCEVIELECMGKFVGDGWRQWVPNHSEVQHA